MTVAAARLVDGLVVGASLGATKVAATKATKATKVTKATMAAASCEVG